MTTKTRNELIVQALINLGALASNQSAEAEDVARIDGFIDPLIERLAEEDIVNVDNVEEIPASWFLPLARILANECKQAFGLAGDEKLETDAQLAERSIKRIVHARPTYETMKGTYF